MAIPEIHSVLILDTTKSGRSFVNLCRMSINHQTQNIRIDISFTSQPSSTLLFPTFFLRQLLSYGKNELKIANYPSNNKTKLFKYVPQSSTKGYAQEYLSETGFSRGFYKKNHFKLDETPCFVLLLENCISKKNAIPELTRHKTNLKFHADADLNTPQDEIDHTLQELEAINGPKRDQLDREILLNKQDLIKSANLLKENLKDKRFIEAKIHGNCGVKIHVDSNAKPYSLTFNFVGKTK